MPKKANSGDSMTSFLNFLQRMETQGLFQHDREPGIVILADDQFITKQQIRMNFGELGISDKLVLFSDGKNVVDFINGTLDAISIRDLEEGEKPLNPITLLLLDINMPVLDGVSVVTALRAMDNDVPVCVLSLSCSRN